MTDATVIVVGIAFSIVCFMTGAIIGEKFQKESHRQCFQYPEYCSEHLPKTYENLYGEQGHE